MTDLPYTYTDSGEDTLAVTKDPSGNRVITVREAFGGKKHKATVYAPTGEAAVALARAVLSAAGDTGHEVISAEELGRIIADAKQETRRQLDEAHSEIRQLLQQRSDLRKERGGAFEKGARSMRERAAEIAETPGEWSRLETSADRIRALSLIPSDGDTVEAQGDLTEEARVALDAVRDGRQYPSPSAARELTQAGLIRWNPRRARYEAVEVAHSGCSQAASEQPSETPSEQPALCAVPCPRGHDHACARSPKHCGPHRDVKQKGEESCSWTDEDVRSDYDSGFADGMRMGDARATATDTEARLAALEALTSDLSNLTHGYGEDVARLTKDMRGVQAAARELGELLRDHVNATVEALKAAQEDGIADQVEKALEGVRANFSQRPKRT